jgi:hypothetical protein
MKITIALVDLSNVHLSELMVSETLAALANFYLIGAGPGSGDSIFFSKLDFPWLEANGYGQLTESCKVIVGYNSYEIIDGVQVQINLFVTPD